MHNSSQTVNGMTNKNKIIKKKFFICAPFFSCHRNKQEYEQNRGTEKCHPKIKGWMLFSCSWSNGCCKVTQKVFIFCFGRGLLRGMWAETDWLKGFLLQKFARDSNSVMVMNYRCKTESKKSTVWWNPNRNIIQTGQCEIADMGKTTIAKVVFQRPFTDAYITNFQTAFQ